MNICLADYVYSLYDGQESLMNSKRRVVLEACWAYKPGAILPCQQQSPIISREPLMCHVIRESLPTHALQKRRALFVRALASEKWGLRVYCLQALTSAEKISLHPTKKAIAVSIYYWIIYVLSSSLNTGKQQNRKLETNLWGKWLSWNIYCFYNIFPCLCMND